MLIIRHWNQFVKKANGWWIIFLLYDGIWTSTQTGSLRLQNKWLELLLVETLVQKEALTICQDAVFALFLCVLSLSPVLESEHLGSQWKQKTQRGEVEDIRSEKIPWNFKICHFTIRNYHAYLRSSYVWSEISFMVFFVGSQREGGRGQKCPIGSVLPSVYLSVIREQ